MKLLLGIVIIIIILIRVRFCSIHIHSHLCFNRRSGREIDEEQATARKEMFRSVVEEESDVYWTSSRVLDDGIIDPRETRTIIGFCLSVIYNNEVKGGNLYGVSRM